MTNEFKNFLQRLFSQMSIGNFVVDVECADNKIFKADVIGYSEEYMTVNVRFHSDKLTKPGTERVSRSGFGFGGPGEEDDYDLKEVQVPVKVESIWWESIKIPGSEDKKAKAKANYKIFHKPSGKYESINRKAFSMQS